MHYTGYVERIKKLKRDGKNIEAMKLLLRCVDATEQEALEEGWGVAPWYYEQLAIIYRKEKRKEDEIVILERYANQKIAPGSKPDKLFTRLQELRNS